MMAPLRNLEREGQIVAMIRGGRAISSTARHFQVSAEHVRTVLERHSQPPPRVMAAEASAGQSPVMALAPTNNVTPFRIEDGIPWPETTARSLYPLEEMAVGQSFLVPCDVKVRHARKRRVDAMIRQHRAHNPECHKKWRSAQVAAGVRVWRFE